MPKFMFDAGHGGHDPGAVSNGLKESVWVLDFTKKVANYLSNNYMGVPVFYTRATDKYITLSERTKMANSINANYFISFHLNAGGGTGFESYIYNGSVSSMTVTAQNVIHNEIAKFLKQYKIRDRGKKRANFAVLRESKMPAILMEMLFIDNKNDAKFLKDPSFVNAYAKAVADAIAKAFGLKKRTESISTSSEISKTTRIVTGGMTPDMLKDVAEFFLEKNWWAQVTFSGKGNPTAKTGGLNSEMKKEFEEWLKKRNWWYKVIQE